MGNSTNTKDKSADQSSFAIAAAELNTEFTEFERLGQAIDRLSVDSDSGLSRAQELLSEFSACGMRIGDGVKALGQSLDEARLRAEKVAEVVAARAAQVQRRQEETDGILKRFQNLGEMVKQITAAVAQFKKPSGERLSAEERKLLAQHLPELDSRLAVLLDEAHKLKDDARAANMKTFERNAESMGQSLQSVRARLSSLAENPSDFLSGTATENTQN